MLLLARFFALCSVLASLLAVTASPLRHNDAATKELDRRGRATDLRVVAVRYHAEQIGPAFFLSEQGFALIKGYGGQENSVFRVNRKLNPNERKLLHTVCQVHFPDVKTDGSQGRDDALSAIAALKSSSVMEFKNAIMQILGKYIRGDVNFNNEWLKDTPDDHKPGKAQSGNTAAGASGSQAAGGQASGQSEAGVGSSGSQAPGGLRPSTSGQNPSLKDLLN
ncbi:hypothetical protein GYMLUDRAFT_96726 [Collybiopsis luxurians FD-317 M1]|uniref:Uncharacterized protein n=1 Tax=Collybiopsis luxurians FD-317 M1 TaxID=944289 RepID=A0A0D0CQT4_9AGAR|nr:hypothetical protein GYMLUDRAFT_96726 [Collybiopsis luxurians FD-317 M1]